MELARDAAPLLVLHPHRTARRRPASVPPEPDLGHVFVRDDELERVAASEPRHAKLKPPRRCVIAAGIFMAEFLVLALEHAQQPGHHGDRVGRGFAGILPIVEIADADAAAAIAVRYGSAKALPRRIGRNDDAAAIENGDLGGERIQGRLQQRLGVARCELRQLAAGDVLEKHGDLVGAAAGIDVMLNPPARRGGSTPPRIRRAGPHRAPGDTSPR